LLIKFSEKGTAVRARTDPCLLTLAVSLLATHNHAAEPVWPTPQAIERAREAHPFPDAERLKRVPVPAVPRIVPTPPSLDIADIARRHIQIKGQADVVPTMSSLRIFVSLSMPETSLRLLVVQAERSGATLLLRGLKANSMKQTLEAVQSLIGNSKVNWQIDPEAYARYSVRHAPTFVLTKSGVTTDSDSAPCGASCVAANAFYSVAGDVSLDYALDAMVRRYPDAQTQVSPFLKRLRTIP
jgi:conjugal transfer pilus assembly protein TrbC